MIIYITTGLTRLEYNFYAAAFDLEVYGAPLSPNLTTPSSTAATPPAMAVSVEEPEECAPSIAVTKREIWVHGKRINFIS